MSHILLSMLISKEIKFTIILAVAITVGIAIVIPLGLQFAFGSINPFYVVSSGSMVPNLNFGDLVIIKHGTNNNDSSSFNNLKIGDIIVFKSFGINSKKQHITIVHRVAHIFTAKNENGKDERIIITKGDANSASIRLVDYPITETNYIGRVVYVVPKVGLISMIGISRPIIYITIGVIIIALVYYFRKARRDQERI